jgi:hypothetical protein
MIAGMFIGCTLFARNALKGQPMLQQRLMKLPLFAGLFSDVSVYPGCSALRHVHDNVSEVNAEMC